jgi:putative oxidoreductase
MLDLFRIVVALLLTFHGIIRLYAGTVNGFGEFLNEKGFLIGKTIAWFLTIFEILGGISMAAGFFRKWIAAVFIVELLMGIILVHAQNGWFVVGYSQNGVEYSILLIASLLLIASTDIKQRIL